FPGSLFYTKIMKLTSFRPLPLQNQRRLHYHQRFAVVARQLAVHPDQGLVVIAGLPYTSLQMRPAMLRLVLPCLSRCRQGSYSYVHLSSLTMPFEWLPSCPVKAYHRNLSAAFLSGRLMNQPGLLFPLLPLLCDQIQHWLLLQLSSS